jgi:division protein CdvB (Snf7/Vps24/ESCRT-III family)
MKDFEEKHNSLATDFSEFRDITYKNLEIFQKNTDSLAQSIAHQDFNIAAMDRILRRVFFMLEVMGVTLDSVKVSDIEDEKVQEIITKSNARYNEEIKAAFEAVAEEIKTAQAAREAQEVAAKAASENAERVAASIAALEEANQKEMELAERALTEAPPLDVVTGGIGTPIPEGAQIFGDD